MILLSVAPSNSQWFQVEIAKPIPKFILSNLNSKIVSLIDESFTKYWQACQDYDYFRPITKTCYGKSSFSLTAIDALESLYLSNVSDSLSHSLRQFAKQLDWEASNYINFYQFSSQIVGGLISAFLVSGEQNYLSKAKEGADFMQNAFVSSIPHPVINGKMRKAMSFDFFNSTFLGESSGFLLEFASISKLTGDDKYLDFVDKYLECINSQLDDRLYLFISQETGKFVMKSHFGLCNFTSAFIENVVKLHKIRPTVTTSELILKISKMFNNRSLEDMIYGEFDIKLCRLLYILGHDFNLLKNVLNNKCKEYQHIHKDFNDKEIFKTKNLTVEEYMLLNHSLISIKSKIPKKLNDLMPSYIFPKFMKNMLMIDSKEEKFIENEASHIIYVF